jgi:hypothetical protein
LDEGADGGVAGLFLAVHDGQGLKVGTIIGF